jgi:hypothetical protein
MQHLLAILLALAFLVNGFHDWIDIPGWTHGRQLRAALRMKKMVIGTVVNCLFPGIAAAQAIYYWQKPVPPGVRNYWLIYCAVVVMGAIAMWWVPYFRGTIQKTKDLYSKMYAGTHQVLPQHGDNPRPNLFHLFLHTLGVINLVLATAFWLNPS